MSVTFQELYWSWFTEYLEAYLLGTQTLLENNSVQVEIKSNLTMSPIPFMSLLKGKLDLLCWIDDSIHRRRTTVYEIGSEPSSNVSNDLALG